MKTVFRTAGVAITLLTAGAAVAHPALVEATPAAKSEVRGVTHASLTFSEAVLAEQSGIVLVMTSMPGMNNHAPMDVTGFKTSLSADGKTLVASFPRALPAGSYQLDWHAAAGEGHASNGTLTFTAR